MSKHPKINTDPFFSPFMSLLTRIHVLLKKKPERFTRETQDKSAEPVCLSSFCERRLPAPRITATERKEEKNLELPQLS